MANSKHVDDMLMRCAATLAELQNIDLIKESLTIPAASKITGGRGSAMIPLLSTDLQLLLMQFIDANPVDIIDEDLTGGRITAIPKSGAGSQLSFPGIQEMVDRLDGQLAVNRIQSETIASLVALLKEKESGR